MKVVDLASSHFDLSDIDMNNFVRTMRYPYSVWKPFFTSSYKGSGPPIFVDILVPGVVTTVQKLFPSGIVKKRNTTHMGVFLGGNKVFNNF